MYKYTGSYSYTYVDMHAGDQVGYILWIKKFVQLMMFKFLPVSALRDKELSEVTIKTEH